MENFLYILKMSCIFFHLLPHDSLAIILGQNIPDNCPFLLSLLFCSFHCTWQENGHFRHQCDGTFLQWSRQFYKRSHSRNNKDILAIFFMSAEFFLYSVFGYLPPELIREGFKEEQALMSFDTANWRWIASLPSFLMKYPWKSFQVHWSFAGQSI